MHEESAPRRPTARVLLIAALALTTVLALAGAAPAQAVEPGLGPTPVPIDGVVEPAEPLAPAAADTLPAVTVESSSAPDRPPASAPKSSVVPAPTPAPPRPDPPAAVTARGEQALEGGRDPVEEGIESGTNPVETVSSLPSRGDEALVPVESPRGLGQRDGASSPRTGGPRPERVRAEIAESSPQARPEGDNTREGAERRAQVAGRSRPSAVPEASVGSRGTTASDDLRGTASDDLRGTVSDDLRRATWDDLRGATPVEPLSDAPQPASPSSSTSSSVTAGSAPSAAAFLETRPTASPGSRERLRAPPPGGGAEAFASVLERPG